MNRDELKKYLLEGLTQREIANIYGKGSSTIGYWIEKLGLKEFSQHQSPRKPIKLNIIDTKEKAYTLGFILADGYIDKDNKTVECTVAIQDKEIVYFISTIIDSNVHEDLTINEEQRRFPRARTKRQIEDILKFTGDRLKSHRSIPNISKEFIRYLLLGFFDGDGCITWNERKDYNGIRHKISFTSQPKLLLGIQNILNDIGIKTNIKDKKGELCNIISFSNKKDVLNFINFLYPKDDVFYILKRKYDKAILLRDILSM